jgi:hypothetical protein
LRLAAWRLLVVVAVVVMVALVVLMVALVVSVVRVGMRSDGGRAQTEGAEVVSGSGFNQTHGCPAAQEEEEEQQQVQDGSHCSAATTCRTMSQDMAWMRPCALAPADSGTGRRRADVACARA